MGNARQFYSSRGDILLRKGHTQCQNVFIKSLYLFCFDTFCNLYRGRQAICSMGYWKSQKAVHLLIGTVNLLSFFLWGSSTANPVSCFFFLSLHTFLICHSLLHRAYFKKLPIQYNLLVTPKRVFLN